MPIYQFQCPKGHTHEVLRAISNRDEPLTCECGLECKRLLSLVNFTFGFTLSGKYYDTPRMSEREGLVRNV